MEELRDSKEAFSDFAAVVEQLRKKCPWDSVQTHSSLKSCMQNELQEVFEGIELLETTGDGENLCEELGDLLMLILLQCEIAGEEGLFTIRDVLDRAGGKMKFRHPKIFAPDDREAASLSWEELKQRERELRENRRSEP